MNTTVPQAFTIRTGADWWYRCPICGHTEYEPTEGRSAGERAVIRGERMRTHYAAHQAMAAQR